METHGLNNFERDELAEIAYCHLYYADDDDPPHRWPERDIDRHALCGWEIPHNLFARIPLAERREWQVCCPDCLDRVIEDGDGRLAAVTPPWDWVKW